MWSLLQLANFGADGLEFSVAYWIDDLENGQGNLRSEINLAILKTLREHGIDDILERLAEPGVARRAAFRARRRRAGREREHGVRRGRARRTRRGLPFARAHLARSAMM